MPVIRIHMETVIPWL